MDKIFEKIKKIFNENGFRIYMIGGTSRDFLLGNKILDYDFVTNATPEDISKFLDVKMTFARFGITNYKLDDFTLDIATLRKETSYKDSRHPNKIEFVKTIEEDFVRRDFTINSIYIDENYKVIDPTNFGVSDLKNKILRFIGDPLVRIKEDPLRILRADRFIEEYSLSMDEKTSKILKENRDLLDKLNPQKITMELKKLERIRK